MNNKIMKWLTAIVVAMLMFVGIGPTLAEAQGDDFNTTVNIHKIKTDVGAEDMSIDDLANGLSEADFLARFGSDAEGLPGVKFSIYSVSEANFNTMMANPGAYDTQGEAAAMGTLVMESAATDGDGLATITLGKGYFWVVENGLGTIASSAAVPFGLSLPYTNADGTANLELIHVYPKNTLAPTPEVDKTIDEDDASQYIGQEFNWTVSSDIPNGIGDYTKYEFVDVIDGRLDYVGVTLNSPAGLNLGDDYTVVFDSTSRALIVDFTVAGLAKLVAGGTISYDIATKINSTAGMGDPIKNDVKLNFTNPHLSDHAVNPDTPEVATGGHKFIKTIGSKDGNGLGLAEFVIINADDEFIIQDPVSLAVSFTSNEDDATRFISGSDGQFEVKGLAYGDYVLREVKAPEGYALPTNPNTSFTVDANSYSLDAAKIIVNRKLTIPQTGGMGTMAFTLLGGMMMVFAVGYYKKTREA